MLLGGSAKPRTRIQKIYPNPNPNSNHDRNFNPYPYTYTNPVYSSPVITTVIKFRFTLWNLSLAESYGQVWNQRTGNDQVFDVTTLWRTRLQITSQWLKTMEKIKFQITVDKAKRFTNFAVWKWEVTLKAHCRRTRLHSRTWKASITCNTLIQAAKFQDAIMMERKIW